MKRLLFLLLLLESTAAFAQVLSGKVLDSVTRQPISLANINYMATGFNVFSDSNGVFKISAMNSGDKLRISNIGYQTKIISLSKSYLSAKDSIFCLSRSVEQLSEVCITSKKTKYGGKKSISAKKTNVRNGSYQFDTEICRYIDNNSRKKGKVEAIVLNLAKMKTDKYCNKCKMDYLASYNVKIYEYDTIRKKPGIEIYANNIIVEPENRSYALKIDVDSLDIIFPKNGICIGVEIINTRYEKPKGAGAFVGPLIQFSDYKFEKPYLAWIRYRNEGWEFKTVLNEKRSEKRYNVPLFDLLVKFER